MYSLINGQRLNGQIMVEEKKSIGCKVYLIESSTVFPDQSSYGQI